MSDAIQTLMNGNFMRNPFRCPIIRGRWSREEKLDLPRCQAVHCSDMQMMPCDFITFKIVLSIWNDADLPLAGATRPQRSEQTLRPPQNRDWQEEIRGLRQSGLVGTQLEAGPSPIPVNSRPSPFLLRRQCKLNMEPRPCSDDRVGHQGRCHYCVRKSDKSVLDLLTASEDNRVFNRTSAQE
jgi:hypothetical protein